MQATICFTSPGEEHDVVAVSDASIFVSSQRATPIVDEGAAPNATAKTP